MKRDVDTILEVIERSLGRYWVKSDRREGEWYQVKWAVGDVWTCNCDAGIYGKACKHVVAAKREVP